MRVHKNYIANNSPNSALPPATVWGGGHKNKTVDITAFQVQAVHVLGLFTVQFCIHKYNIQHQLKKKQPHITIHANFLLPGPICQTTLAHPVSGCIPEDFEDSITSTLCTEMGVTSSLTRNLEETG
jgi:hypothetical protein